MPSTNPYINFNGYRLNSGQFNSSYLMRTKAHTMRFRILTIKKETFKLFGNYLGLMHEQKPNKPDCSIHRNADTPDFYNSRLGNNHRKNLSTTRPPGKP